MRLRSASASKPGPSHTDDSTGPSTSGIRLCTGDTTALGSVVTMERPVRAHPRKQERPGTRQAKAVLSPRTYAGTSEPGYASRAGRRRDRQALAPPRGAEGGGQARRGHARVAPGNMRLPAGRARASTHRRGRLTGLFMGSRTAAPGNADSKVFRDDGPGRRIEMRWRAANISEPACRATSPRILACQASGD